jgi:uncharacterized RDD family membrane protein YckC
MNLECPHCEQRLVFSGKRPSFCAYCGKAIEQQTESTATLDAEAATLPPVPGSRPSPPPPEILGGYRLLKPLGEGGMGSVYEAEEISTGRHVALKMIATEHAAADDAVERFRREGRLASTVVDSRCVFILAADEEAGRPYIVMELMPGTTLKDLVDKQGPLPPADAISKILDVIDGLRAAHRLGVVHRDVKPSNCFLEEDGRVKIGDFGLSKSLVQEGHLTRTGSFLGTPLFASPEQVRGETFDQQSDLYSVAATLYCLLTGRAPFQSTDAAVTLARIASDPAPPMRTLRPDLPQALDDVVLRGLERDRARRWPDLDEFRAALLPFLPGWQEAAGLGVRFGAFLIDYLLLMGIGLVIALGMFVVLGEGMVAGKTTHTPMHMVFGLLSWVLLFGVPESIWGCSLGKWALSLRVRNAARNRRAAPGRILVRTLCFYALANLGSLAAMPLLWGLDTMPSDVQLIRSMLFLALFYPLTALGIGMIFITMRSRNGFRGLHEFVSGTRVVRLPDAEKRTVLRSGPRELALEQPPGLPERRLPLGTADPDPTGRRHRPGAAGADLAAAPDRPAADGTPSLHHPPHTAALAGQWPTRLAAMGCFHGPDRHAGVRLGGRRRCPAMVRGPPDPGTAFCRAGRGGEGGNPAICPRRRSGSCAGQWAGPPARQAAAGRGRDGCCRGSRWAFPGYFAEGPGFAGRGGGAVPRRAAAAARPFSREPAGRPGRPTRIR